MTDVPKIGYMIAMKGEEHDLLFEKVHQLKLAYRSLRLFFPTKNIRLLKIEYRELDKQVKIKLQNIL